MAGGGGGRLFEGGDYSRDGYYSRKYGTAMFGMHCHGVFCYLRSKLCETQQYYFLPLLIHKNAHAKLSSRNQINFSRKSIPQQHFDNLFKTGIQNLKKQTNKQRKKQTG